MTIEIEVKVRIRDPDEVERRLQGLGAKLIDIVEEVDSYVDLAPCIDMRKQDMALRIRKRRSLVTGESINELTFKGRRMPGAVKARKEITVVINDGEKFLEILRELGFSSIYTVFKTRKIFALEDLKIFIDNVKELGTFLEIEAPSTMNVEKFGQVIKDLFNVLGVDESCVESKTYLELLLERREKNRR
ncbi:MAG: class IV adenylate cyclase [Ignisphaera sp.]|nr:class IV adenylate cyclase [Ignisphaera sp.]